MRAKRRERKRNIGVGVAKFNTRVAKTQDRCEVGGGKLRRGQGERRQRRRNNRARDKQKICGRWRRQKRGC